MLDPKRSDQLIRRQLQIPPLSARSLAIAAQNSKATLDPVAFGLVEASTTFDAAGGYIRIVKPSVELGGNRLALRAAERTETRIEEVQGVYHGSFEAGWECREKR